MIDLFYRAEQRREERGYKNCLKIRAIVRCVLVAGVSHKRSCVLSGPYLLSSSSVLLIEFEFFNNCEILFDNYRMAWFV